MQDFTSEIDPFAGGKLQLLPKILKDFHIFASLLTAYLLPPEALLKLNVSTMFSSVSPWTQLVCFRMLEIVFDSRLLVSHTQSTHNQKKGSQMIVGLG